MIEHVQLFRDKVLNQALFEDGYITLPFLNTDELEKLRSLFYKFHSDEEVNGIHVSSHTKNEKIITSINDGIRAVFKRSIEEHILDGQTLGGTFITKAPNVTDKLEPHQDWSIVDESRFRSFTIWVPLDDTNDENGCLYVLPKSHEFVRGYRHVTIPSVFGPIYETVWKHMTPIHLKAGEAIVFDHALGHASKPNLTNQARIAATHSLISPNAEMRFYCNNNGTVEEYRGENGYYNTEQAKVGGGHLTKLRDLDFKMHQLDEQEFYTLAGIEPPVEPAKRVEKRGLAKWFEKLIN